MHTSFYRVLLSMPPHSSSRKGWMKSKLLLCIFSLNGSASPYKIVTNYYRWPYYGGTTIECHIILLNWPISWHGEHRTRYQTLNRCSGAEASPTKSACKTARICTIFRRRGKHYYRYIFFCFFQNIGSYNIDIYIVLSK